MIIGLFLPDVDFHPRLCCLENKSCLNVILIVGEFGLVGKRGWKSQSWAGLAVALQPSPGVLPLPKFLRTLTPAPYQHCLNISFILIW